MAAAFTAAAFSCALGFEEAVEAAHRTVAEAGKSWMEFSRSEAKGNAHSAQGLWNFNRALDKIAA